ncbi:MAG: tyrosine-type recombinase/integrase [Thermoplasmata archaeon]|nr:tyrosine-type recombinase/integrase [Thermoplasmata archaeon]NIY05147.1 tyrosine-type recombinase/integrase [Thermoplasmata archaeon]
MKVTEKGHGAGQPSVNKGRKFPAEILTSEEALRLLQACSTRGSAGLRSRTVVVLLWRAGLRMSEVLGLYPKDVDLENGVVQVLHGKGDKRRIVGLDAQAAAVVSTWLERRKALGLNGRHRLVCTLKGRPVHSSQIRQTLRRLGRKAGIEKRVHAHGLRHSFAVSLLREGQNVGIIQGALGHSNIATTSRYLAHLAPEEVVAAMKGREW